MRAENINQLETELDISVGASVAASKRQMEKSQRRVLPERTGQGHPEGARRGEDGADLERWRDGSFRR